MKNIITSNQHIHINHKKQILESSTTPRTERKTELNFALKTPPNKSQKDNKMTKELQPIDMVTDVYVPAVIIAVLFIVNGIILFYIFQKRKLVVYEDINDEPATTSTNAGQRAIDDGNTIELGSLWKKIWQNILARKQKQQQLNN